MTASEKWFASDLYGCTINQKVDTEKYQGDSGRSDTNWWAGIRKYHLKPALTRMMSGVRLNNRQPVLTKPRTVVPEPGLIATRTFH
jgi:hypothetical protein